MAAFSAFDFLDGNEDGHQPVPEYDAGSWGVSRSQSEAADVGEGIHRKAILLKCPGSSLASRSAGGSARGRVALAPLHLLNVRVDNRRRLGPVALVTFLDLENIYNRFNTNEERFSALTGKERAIRFRFLGNAGLKLEL